MAVLLGTDLDFIEEERENGRVFVTVREVVPGAVEKLREHCEGARNIWFEGRLSRIGAVMPVRPQLGEAKIVRVSIEPL